MIAQTDMFAHSPRCRCGRYVSPQDVACVRCCGPRDDGEMWARSRRRVERAVARLFVGCTKQEG